LASYRETPFRRKLMSSDIPRLVDWLELGRIPGEVKNEIRNAELHDNLSKLPTTPQSAEYHLTTDAPQPSEIDAFKVSQNGSLRGVELVAKDILNELRGQKQKGSAKVAALRWRAYALLAWCSQEGKSPPPLLMRLLFECLVLQEGKPPKEVCERYKWPNLKTDHDEYDRVVEADAQSLFETKKEMSLRALSKKANAKQADADKRKKILEWRKTPEYKKRRNVFVLRLMKRHADGDQSS
jgi:hypothetical protein